MSDFPTTADELTPERLTGMLHATGHLSRARVVAVSTEVIGTGKMGDNARIALSYDAPEPGAPQTLVAKLPAADERARTMAGAGGAYYNEVMFYRELAGGTSMRTPRIYASEISEDRRSFLLLMEDLAPARPDDQRVGASRDHARLALAEAAKLAGAFYDDESLGGRDHVQSSARDGGALGQALMQQSWPGFVDRYGHGMSAACIAFGERYVASHARFATRFQGPRTLVHGDFRSENLLFDGETVTTVDWQTTSASGPVTDAAYYLGGSVAVEDRRAWERDLVEAYRIELDKSGASLSAGECWEQYREFAMHGILITVLGASFSTPDERSDGMFLAMIRRHLQHCIDLDAGEFLD